jgi:uncharacterized membrane protein YqjE
MSFVEKSRSAELLAADSAAFNPLDALRLLRSAGKALFAQLALHGKLALVEWAEEKNRLTKMLIVALLGFACVLCVMLLSSALVLAIFWDTAYRLPAVMALLIVFATGIAYASYRLHALAALGSQAFASSREEFATDMAMLRSQL